MKKLFAIMMILCIIFSIAACGQKTEPEEAPLPPETQTRSLGTVHIGDFSGMTAASDYSNETMTLSAEDAQKITDLLNGCEITDEFPALDPDWTVSLDTETIEIIISDGIIGIYYKDQKEISGCLPPNNLRDTTLAQILAKYGLIPYDEPLPPEDETSFQTVGTIEMENAGTFHVTCQYPEEYSAELTAEDSQAIMELLNGKELIGEFSACDSDLSLTSGDWSFIIHTDCSSVAAYHGDLEGSGELSKEEVTELRNILSSYQ